MWAKVDDGMWKHRKFRLLSLEARGLWVTALSHCGMEQCPQVDRDFLTFALAALDVDFAEAAAELVDAGLWVESDDGWTIHDWDDYQADSLSRQRAEAGKVGGLTRSLNAAQAKIEQLEAELEESGDSSPKASNDKQPSSNGQAEPQATGKQTPKHGPEPVPEPAPTSLPLARPPDGGRAASKPSKWQDDSEFVAWWDKFKQVAEGRSPTGAPSRAWKPWKRLTIEQKRAAYVGLSAYDELLRAQDHGRRDADPAPNQHGSTWLNDRRWESVADELETVQAKIKPKAKQRDTCPDCGQYLNSHNDKVCQKVSAA